MKKLYASLALVAAGAIAATAATIPAQQNFTEINNLRGSKIMDFSERLPISAVADQAQKINNRYSANRAAAAFEGSYLTTGVGGFDGYEANGKFTVTAEGYLDGFGGFSYDVNYVEAIKFDHPFQATVADNGDIQLALGQSCGTYSGSPIILFGVKGTGDDAELVLEGTLTYKASEDGSYAEDMDGVAVGFLNANNRYSLFSYEMNSKILKPNATVTYHWTAGNGSDNGNFSVPAFIGFEDEEYEGMTFTSMYMSALMYELTGDGYPATYEVEESVNGNGFDAIANSPICVYNEDNDIVEGGNIVYGQLATTISTYTTDVIWNLDSNKEKVELSEQEITGKTGTGTTDCLYIHNDGYTFGTLENVQVAMEVDGVEEIIADAAASNENAPVEYYNLQGMKINNPAAGQIVIRRQGNKTAKMIVR